MAAIAAAGVSLWAHVGAAGAVLVDASWSVAVEESIERQPPSGGKASGTATLCAGTAKRMAGRVTARSRGGAASLEPPQGWLRPAGWYSPPARMLTGLVEGDRSSFVRW
jgi:hypothetical protein